MRRVKNNLSSSGFLCLLSLTLFDVAYGQLSSRRESSTLVSAYNPRTLYSWSSLSQNYRHTLTSIYLTSGDLYDLRGGCFRNDQKFEECNQQMADLNPAIFNFDQYHLLDAGGALLYNFILTSAFQNGNLKIEFFRIDLTNREAAYMSANIRHGSLSPLSWAEQDVFAVAVWIDTYFRNRSSLASGRSPGPVRRTQRPNDENRVGW